jgi:hypothetical protein
VDYLPHDGISLASNVGAPFVLAELACGVLDTAQRDPGRHRALVLRTDKPAKERIDDALSHPDAADAAYARSAPAKP